MKPSISQNSTQSVEMVTKSQQGNYSKGGRINSQNLKVVTVIKKDKSLKNVKEVVMDELVEYFKDFKIRAIKSQSCGIVIRIKKIGCRHTHVSLNLCSDRVINRNECLPTNTKAFVKMDNGIIPLENTIVEAHSSNLQCATLTHSADLKSTKKKKKLKKQFSAYWNALEVEKGLLSGELIKGAIRINPKNICESYISNEDQSQQDYVLTNIIDRNRALEGDIVIIKLKPEEEWNEKQKTAIVVYIEKKVHSRLAVGQLARNKKSIMFIPRDKRIPKMKIPKKGCPINVQNKTDVLLRGKMRSWTDVDFAEGTVLDVLGLVGDLNSELSAILAEHGIDVTPYSPDLLKYIRSPDDMSELELKNRYDLRKECIFTIDPLTARDLDDAMSCKELPNGNLQIGVHISDVGYYLTEGTPLDAIVCKKATSVYFVNNVYHMLPPELCMQCSLLPGVSKYAFSIIWEMTRTGDIVTQSIVRSFINSCTQLAYEHAQLMIENPNHEFKDSELPPIYGGYTYKDLSHSINILQEIAVILRKRRFDNGALKINQTKLLFSLDPESGEPTQFFTYENKDAHRLIEEFMLLANSCVAQKIVANFPDIAFLRCHDPPKESMMVELKNNLELHGINLDITSSKTIEASICEASGTLGVTQMTVLNHLLAKPMNRARYFCARTQENFSHYALHIPIYTHFTSPIRRYADIMVHRLLAASLGYTPKPKWNIDTVSSIAANCNKQKYSAKLAGDASSNIYLVFYIEKYQPFVRSAVVFHVRNRSFDILVPSTGSILRIYEESFEKGVWKSKERDDQCTVILTFPSTIEYRSECVVIKMFEIITVNLDRKPNTNSLRATMLRPITSQLIQNTSGAFSSD